jgi:UDP-glucose 4-epimerase
MRLLVTGGRYVGSIAIWARAGRRDEAARYGFSILEVIVVCLQATGRDVPSISGPRRRGGSATLIVSNDCGCSEGGRASTRTTQPCMVPDAWDHRALQRDHA